MIKWKSCGRQNGSIIPNKQSTRTGGYFFPAGRLYLQAKHFTMFRLFLTGLLVFFTSTLLAQSTSNLTISTTGTSNLKFKLGNYKYSPGDRTTSFQGLTPGTYDLVLYQLQPRINGGSEYVQVYNSSIKLTAGRHLEVTVMRFGKIAWDEGNIQADNWNDSYNNPSPLGADNTYTTGSSWEQMSAERFATVKGQVRKEFSSETQLAVAKAAIKNYWVTTAQVKELCEIFFGDDPKLALAKYAYDNCSDKGNYLNLLDIFFSSTNKNNLLNYINSR